MVGIEAVEGTAAGAGIEPHGAGPEPAGAVASGIVEAVVREIGLGIDDRLEPARLEVERLEPRLGDRHETARLAQRQGRDETRHRPDLVPAGLGVQAMDRRGQNIDPVEPPLVGRPERPLAQIGVGRQHAGHLGRRRSRPAAAP